MAILKHRGRGLRFKGKYLSYPKNTLNPRTQSLLDYATLMGYAPPSNIGALDRFIGNMNPILDKLDLFYIFFGDGDVNFKLLNIVDPLKYKGTAFGGLTWNNDGVKGNGTNGYINTNFNPAFLVEGQKYQLNDASRGGICFQKENDGVNDNVMDGQVVTSTPSNVIILLNHSTQRINSVQTLATPVNMSGLGFKSISRTSNSNVKLVNKNIDTDRTSTAITSLHNLYSYILRTGTAYGSLGLSNYFIGASLTYEETQLIRQYTNEYLQELGLPQVA